MPKLAYLKNLKFLKWPLFLTFYVLLAYMSYTNIGHTTGYILSFWSALWLNYEPSYGNFKIWLTFWPRGLIVRPMNSKTLNVDVWYYVTYVDQDWCWFVRNFDQYLWKSDSFI